MTDIERKIRDKTGRIKKNVTMNDLVSTGVLADELSKMARIFGVDIPIHVVTDKSICPTACTDGSWIMINPLSSFAVGLQLPQQIMICFGMLLHELGHCFYTSFTTKKRLIEKLKKGEIPFGNFEYSKKDLRNLESIKRFISTGANPVIKLYTELLNITEDSHIEPRMINSKPTIGNKYLGFLRQIHSAEAPSVEDYDDAPPYIAFVNTYLHYAKFGILQFDNVKHRIVKLIQSVSELTEHAIYNMRYMTRAEHTWHIFVRLWKDVFEEIANDEKALEEFARIIRKSCSPHSNSAKDSEHRKDETGECPPVGPSAYFRGQIVFGTDDDEDEIHISESSIEKIGTKDEETERMKLSDGSAKSVDGDGTTEFDNNYFGRQDFEAAIEDINRILNEAAKKLAVQECEREFCTELANDINDVDFTDIHKNVRKYIHRMPCVNRAMIDTYNAIIANSDVRNAISTLTRYFELLFKTPNYRTPCVFGSRLDKNQLCNEDITGKIFYNKSRKAPTLCLALRIDESGSMRGNNRAYHARIVAIIIQAVCEKIGIPVLIYGDISDTFTGKVDLFSYCDFDSIDKNDKYRLVDISARQGSNRDGAALLYLMSRLAARPEKHKILLSISDGQPNSLHYSGQAAVDDIKGIIQHSRQKGIITFGAAIGSDKEKIRECYGQGFLDVSDIRSLPTTLYSIIRTKIK